LFLQVLAFLWCATLALASPPHGLSEPAWQRWLEINYYQPSSKGDKSEITNADYFLIPTGPTNPTGELAALLAVLKDPNKQEEACRFPARTTWAYEHMPQQLPAQRPQCPEFSRVSDPGTIQEISLLFASGYFESPASAFGHVLLKFAPEANLFTDYFMDSSLNYGANTQGQDVGVRYIFNGLLGGYSASYQRNNAFLNTHSYTARQQRDVWEYPLKLSAAQRRFVIEHSYELKRARFTYYFLNDNCAHRIARLLQMATQGGYQPPKRSPWLQPGQVVQSLQAQGWVRGETRHVALKSDARTTYAALPAASQTRIRQALKTAEKLAALNDAELRLLNQLLDVEAASFANKPRNAKQLEAVHARRQQVLLARLARPPLGAIGPTTEPPSTATTPAKAPPPAKLSVAQVFGPTHATRLTFRAANHDLLALPMQGQPPSQFVFGEVTAQAGEGGGTLHSATLLDIISLNPQPLPQMFGTERSWAMQAGYGPADELCTKCRRVAVEGKLGHALAVGADATLFALAGGQLNSRQTQANDYAGAVAELGAILPLGQTRALATYRATLGVQEGPVRHLAKLEFSQPLNLGTELRLSAAHNGHQGTFLVGFGFGLE
jgi:hypothetical protein